MKVVSLYSSLLALLFFILSVRAVRMRRTLKIGVGDGGSGLMLRSIRVHSNFAEYVPLCLLLLYFVSQTGVDSWVLHALGLPLLTGRLSHAYGLSQEREDFRFRIAGMALTFTVMMLSAGYLFVWSWLQ